MRLRGAIFDFDGTLFDTMSVWDTAGEDYLRLIGMTPGETINEELKTMSLQQAAEAIKEQYRIPKSTETIIDEVNEMVGDFYLYRAEPKQGIEEFLEQLDKDGVSMCITTAAERRLVEGALKRCSLDRFFGEIFTCGEVGHGKDEPMIYEQARSWGRKKRRPLYLRMHIMRRGRRKTPDFRWQPCMTAMKQAARNCGHWRTGIWRIIGAHGKPLTSRNSKLIQKNLNCRELERFL